ncbi:MAG: efflux RND transporter periplasmic adaptor subunit [Pseudomonadota bacterium]
MRLGPVLLSLAIVVGLAYWFGFRDPEQRALLADLVRGDVEAEMTEVAAPEAPETDKLQPVAVMVLLSEARETARQLVLRGRTEANRKVAVPAETTGLVISQPIRRGSVVREGQVLCELSQGTRQAQLLEAEAGLARAKINYDVAMRLSERGFAAETTRMERSAELEAAQAAVELVQWDISRLQIVAPFDGVLESDTAELGARLAPGETCADLIDLSMVKVAGFVGEQNVDQIALGQPATARMINGRREAGEITFISRVADEDTRTYKVDVTLENVDGRLRDGMTSEMVINLPPRQAHRIPKSALTLDDTGRLGLRLAEGTASTFYPVEVVRDDPDGIWVAGLPDKATVIVVGQEFVSDGREIRAVPITWDDLG